MHLFQQECRNRANDPSAHAYQYRFHLMCLSDFFLIQGHCCNILESSVDFNNHSINNTLTLVQSFLAYGGYHDI